MRLALFLTIVLTTAASAPASALTWSAPKATELSVGAIDVDDQGLGAFSSGTSLVPVAADGTPGTAIAYPEAIGPIAFDVSDTGRVAVIARLTETTLGLGVGTTAAPPTVLESSFTALDGQKLYDHQVSIGRDGRLLVAWSQQGETGSAAVAARLAPGASTPAVTTLESYDAATGGYPPSFAINDVTLDNSGRSLIRYERSSPTGPAAYISRSESPDGAFGKPRAALSGGRYTKQVTTELEGTGGATFFGVGVNTAGTSRFDALFSRQLTPQGKTTRDFTLGVLADSDRWAADVGANGSGAVVWTNRNKLRVRTRSEKGVWDAKAEFLIHRLSKRVRTPAISVSKLGRKVVAYPAGKVVVAAFGKPGAKFGLLQPIPSSDGCDKVQLATSGSGRTVAVLSCGDEFRLSTTNAR